MGRFTTAELQLLRAVAYCNKHFIFSGLRNVRRPVTSFSPGLESARELQVVEDLERETGIEPATNSLEGCDSTIELLPPAKSSLSSQRSAERSAGLRRLGCQILAALQARAIPAGQARAGLISALAELEHGNIRRLRRARVLVVQNKLSKLRVPMPGAHRFSLQSGRRRSAVGVKGRVTIAAVAGPEAATGDLVRIRLASHLVRAFALRRAASRKARHRQVKGPPEEMHRARLADKPGTKFLENAVACNQNPAESLDVFDIVRGVVVVLVERRPIVKLHGLGVDPNLDLQPTQRAPVFGVEIRHRPGKKADRSPGAGAGLYPELVVEEIDINAEASIRVRNRRSGETAGRDIERHVPPMILKRRQSQARLADDLRPQVQRVAGVFPGVERQRRPIAHLPTRCERLVLFSPQMNSINSVSGIRRWLSLMFQGSVKVLGSSMVTSISSVP